MIALLLFLILAYLILSETVTSALYIIFGAIALIIFIIVKVVRSRKKKGRINQ
jgi:hypothetical protein